MKAFKIDTDGKAEVKEIVGDLKSLQEEVGGLITLAPYFEELERHDIDIFADDEGLLKSNPIFTLLVPEEDDPTDVAAALAGNLIFVSHDDEGGTVGLTNKQIDFIAEHLTKVRYYRPAFGEYKTAYTFIF